MHSNSIEKLKLTLEKSDCIKHPLSYFSIFQNLGFKEFSEACLTDSNVIKAFIKNESRILKKQWADYIKSFERFKDDPSEDNKRIFQMHLSFFKICYKMFRDMSLTAKINKFRKKQIGLKGEVEQSTDPIEEIFKSVCNQPPDYQAELDYLKKREAEDKKKREKDKNGLPH